MASLSTDLPAGCFEDEPEARAVARGVGRLFHRRGWSALCEVPLGNGRRADMMALDASGRITIVEIKVSRADLLGDAKWPDYLEYCDFYYWAVPAGFDLALFERSALEPALSGLIVADAYDAAVAREPAERKVAPARRKAETLRFARRAATRLLVVEDPNLSAFD